MRVVHVYKDYPPVIGGIENHLKLLAEGQAERGLEVTVLVTSTDRHTTVRREGGVRVIRAARWLELRSTPISPALVGWLHRLEVDVVHLQFPYPWGELAQLMSRLPASRGACRCGRALVISYQSDIVRQRLLGWLYRPLMRRLLDRADRILASSEAYLRSSEVLAAHASKATVVPLGVEVDRFASPDPERVAEIRRRFPGPLVLFVGRLRYYKGLEVLLAAMGRLAAERFPGAGRAQRAPATLLIAGSGPRAARCRREARASAAAEQVRLLGDVADSELAAYYAAADVFVLPSSRRSEAYGLALAEAMAAGTAAVSTELQTGTSVVNRDGETGLVVPPRDPEALAAALRKLLGDPELRREMGERARRRARRDLDAGRMVERVIHVYRQLLP